MDYPDRRRLKMSGQVEVIDADDGRLRSLVRADYGARVERGLLIHVAGFDWNCPPHITERYELADIEQATEALQARIADLERQLAGETRYSSRPAGLVQGAALVLPSGRARHRFLWRVTAMLLVT